MDIRRQFFIHSFIQTDVNFCGSLLNTAHNKETALHIFVPGSELHAEKVCDTFEEGVDLCIDALQKQLSKLKEKNAK